MGQPSLSPAPSLSLLLSQQLHLFAVFVVVHAGQSLVRVAVDVCVGSTHVPIPGPTHVALIDQARVGRAGLSGEADSASTHIHILQEAAPTQSLALPSPSLTAQVTAPLRSKRQCACTWQGLWAGLWQVLAGKQPWLWLPRKPKRQGPHLKEP